MNLTFQPPLPPHRVSITDATYPTRHLVTCTCGWGGGHWYVRANAEMVCREHEAGRWI